MTLHKSILLVFISVCLSVSAFSSGNGKSKTIEIEFNRNIEFLGFIYHMGWLGPELDASNAMMTIENKEIRESEWRAYGYHVYSMYKSYLQSLHLARIVEIGTYLDFSPIINVAMAVDDFPNAVLNERVSPDDLRDFSSAKDLLEGREVAEKFFSALNEFYREVNFDDYFLSSKSYYDTALSELQKVKPEEGFIETMEAFYQKKFRSYILVPSLLIPAGMGFGIRIGENDSTDIFNIFGPQDAQVIDNEELKMGFDSKVRMRELSVHEFGHSFVNPVIDAFPEHHIRETEHLFDTIRNEMTDQGYNTWKTSVYEHFVRAGEVVIAQIMGHDQNARDMQEWYINGRKFIYLPVIIGELQKYREGNHKTYQETVNSAFQKLRALSKTDSESVSENRKIEDVIFHTEDITRFWEVFDQTYPNLDGQIFQENYINTGSEGLKFFIDRRIENGSKLSSTIKNNLKYYKNIRETSLTIDRNKEQILLCYARMKELYPPTRFPEVYFVIGRLNSGGTSFSGGLVMGAEMFGKPSNGFQPRIDIRHLEKIIAHELVHFQQNYPEDKSLLAQTIREGSADFLANLIVGETPGAHIGDEIKSYVKTHHESLWKEFLEKKDHKNYHNWLYTVGNKDRPKDLGYWMGFMITKYHYDHAKDKKQAIIDILNIQDFEAFLEQSGYIGEWE